MRKYRILTPWLIILVGIGGCQIVRGYHDSLIETSLISEIPTIAGNLVGGIAGLPFLVVSAPIGYAVYPSSHSMNEIDNGNAPATVGNNGGERQSPGVQPNSKAINTKANDNKNIRDDSSSPFDNSQRRKDFILAPVYTGSYTFGILLGTPFYPFALLFSRERPAAAK